MTIKVGDRLPSGTLSEFIEVETAGCTRRPQRIQGRRSHARQEGRDLRPARRIHAHVLGEARPELSCANYDKLKAKGVDEMLCMSVNDPFVMGAWATDQKAGGKVRMMADGSGTYTKALGLELDLIARGLGMRCQRFSMLVDDGVVKTLNIEAPGKYEVSGADTMLQAARLTATRSMHGDESARRSTGAVPTAARLRLRRAA